MAEYKGTVELISGITPKNGGDFPLVNAKDVQMPDGTRLSEFTGGNGSGGVNGKDGVSITKAEINSDGELVLTFSDGNTTNVGRVVGEDGQDGAPGQNGVDGKDGTNGTNGKDGEDGYTPVKGVDYFTEADISAIVEQVISTLPTAEEVSI